MNTTHRLLGARSRVAALFAAAALAGCGGGGGDGIGVGSAPAPAPAPNAPSLPAVPENLALNPTTACTMQGIGAAQLTADKPVTILDVSTGTTTGTPAVPYCLVKVKVDPAINIWVTMPSSAWNGRLRAEGGGGYAGTVGVATDSVRQNFVGTQTDTGHPASAGGSFGMQSPGVPNTQLQQDFAFRSEHLMAVVGKQLAKAFYGQDTLRSYWYGCSTGGRQGLRMAQDFPGDYDAILAGAPAIHWDRFQAYQIWPQVVMKQDVGGPISTQKQTLATNAAIAACDAKDGVVDGVIGDPRSCTYDPRFDTTITKAGCATTDNTCLSPAEAGAIQKIWGGARDAAGNLLWPGLERGAPLFFLAGATPFAIAVDQPKYWVYLDPNWDWTTLNYTNYGDFFAKTVQMVGPMMASDNPDLSAFKARGGKLIMYHGWADPLIMPEGTIMYYNAMQEKMGATTDFARLYMVPGMGHCSGGTGATTFGQSNSTQVPQTPTRDAFRALMAWSEKGSAPDTIVASHLTGTIVDETRPLCPYPKVARYNGSGSTDDASNFSCVNP